MGLFKLQQHYCIKKVLLRKQLLMAHIKNDKMNVIVLEKSKLYPSEI